MRERGDAVTPILCAAAIALMLILHGPLMSRGDETITSLRVPAFAAYSEPDPEALRIGRRGLTGWTQGGEQLVWYGKIGAAGRLTIGLTVRLPALSTAKYQLT